MLSVVVEPERVRVGKRFSVSFQRTLRIPDDGRTYPLPPGFGPLPVHRVEDFADRVPIAWRERGGVFIPMYQREALWLAFEAATWKPNAVMVGVGGINAVSGEDWEERLDADPQNYLVCPEQPWLDGINAGDGTVRQFVAMPLGSGYTVEAELTGAERVGGIQIVVFEPRAGRFPSRPPRGGPSAESACGLEGVAGLEMGVAAGGSMRQKIYEDAHGIDTWDPANRGRVFVHLVNGEQYQALTGRESPPSPVGVEDYARARLPWFDLYDESVPHVAASDRLAGVRSIREQDERRGRPSAEPSVVPTSVPVTRLRPSRPGGTRVSPTRERQMADQQEWAAEVARTMPDLDRVAEELDRRLDQLVDSAALPPEPAEGAEEDEDGEEGVGLEASPGAAPAEPGSEGLRDVRDSAKEDLKRLLGAGKRGLEKLRKKGKDADLDPDEQAGAEAIILLTGRPALLIQGGSFFPPPDDWKILGERRADIEQTFQSVGRIELTGHPTLEWVGTGFVVAPNVVMTNRHVAVEFCRQAGRGKWEFERGIKARIDFVEELGSTTSVEVPLTEVIGVHDEVDLALFRTAARPSTPSPLPVASKGTKVKAGRQVYVVGYPASDSRRNDPDVMRRIFAGVYNCKRLQPGEVKKVSAARSALQHDCSTLGGNSGSCVLDLETHQVVGLHFGGKYREANHAVALWALAGDSLLKKAKVNFV